MCLFSLCLISLSVKWMYPKVSSSSLIVGSWVSLMRNDKLGVFNIGLLTFSWKQLSDFCVFNTCWVLKKWVGDHIEGFLSKSFCFSFWVSLVLNYMGFPGGSDGKESACNAKEPVCNAGDLGLIPGSGGSPGGGHGNPLQYSCLENRMDRGAWRATVHGVAKVGHESATKYSTLLGLPRWHSGKESSCQCRRHKRLRFLGWEGPLE